ncbi:Septin family protein [Aspergillus niger]|uniref:Septin family protein n=1 Tax=Aspergillus niger TaxID=5061 RepID=A0A505I995_ASPNG|nr:Septin family protein [Aspergillus niger]
MAIKSSILYENPSATAFVVDIPSSIAQAQALPGQDFPPSRPHPAPSASGSYHGGRVLLSSTPLREPYPSSTEPKTEAARARVLERIPLSERRYHSELIEPLVTEKLTELNAALENNNEWCLPRIIVDSDAQGSPGDPTQGGYEQIQPGKRKRQRSIAASAIWITNSAKARKTAYEAIRGAGLEVCEEWVWLKTTMDGRPITEVGGLWRKPYEVLVIGRQVRESSEDGDVVRRVIAAVPDVHSRKPNLKELFERMFFSSLEGGCVPYNALEVFARNLTAGWWACGDDVLKFNSEEWWVDDTEEGKDM